MNRITVNDALKNQLGGIAGPIELCDAAGTPIGHFLPLLPVGATDKCPYSPQELQRMRQETGGRSLASIWQSLGAK